MFSMIPARHRLGMQWTLNQCITVYIYKFWHVWLVGGVKTLETHPLKPINSTSEIVPPFRQSIQHRGKLFSWANQSSSAFRSNQIYNHRHATLSLSCKKLTQLVSFTKGKWEKYPHHISIQNKSNHGSVSLLFQAGKQTRHKEFSIPSASHPLSLLQSNQYHVQYWILGATATWSDSG